MSKRNDINDLIIKFNVIHNNKYTYKNVIYTSMHNKISIQCKKHGLFMQRPNDHIRGHGCPSCMVDDIKIRESKTDTEWIDKFNFVHDHRYTYSDSDISCYKKLRITCPVHGEFTQAAYSHGNGRGCPKCSRSFSRYEKRLCNIFKSSIFRYKPAFMNGKEIDIYLPDLNIGIEINGSAWHHSNLDVEFNKFLNRCRKDYLYHFNKFYLCKNNNIKLIHLSDVHLLNIEDCKILQLVDVVDNNDCSFLENFICNLYVNKNLKDYIVHDSLSDKENHYLVCGVHNIDDILKLYGSSDAI